MLRPPRARGLIAAALLPFFLMASACCDCEDQVATSLEMNDSVVIEPASPGGSATRVAVDSVVIEPRAAGGRTLRVYPQ